MKKNLVALALASAIIGNCVSLSSATPFERKVRERNAQIAQERRKKVEQAKQKRQHPYEEAARILQERQNEAHVKLRRRAKSAPSSPAAAQQQRAKCVQVNRQVQPLVQRRSESAEPTVPAIPFTPQGQTRFAQRVVVRQPEESSAGESAAQRKREPQRPGRGDRIRSSFIPVRRRVPLSPIPPTPVKLPKETLLTNIVLQNF